MLIIIINIVIESTFIFVPIKLLFDLLFQATGSVEYYRLFCLDRLGFPMDEIAGEAQLQENIKVMYPAPLDPSLYPCESEGW